MFTQTNWNTVESLAMGTSSDKLLFTAFQSLNKHHWITAVLLSFANYNSWQRFLHLLSPSKTTVVLMSVWDPHSYSTLTQYLTFFLVGGGLFICFRERKGERFSQKNTFKWEALWESRGWTLGVRFLETCILCCPLYFMRFLWIVLTMPWHQGGK